MHGTQVVPTCAIVVSIYFPSGAQVLSRCANYSTSCPRWCPSFIHIVLEWCQVVSIYVTRCVELVPLILLQLLECLPISSCCYWGLVALTQFHLRLSENKNDKEIIQNIFVMDVPLDCLYLVPQLCYAFCYCSSDRFHAAYLYFAFMKQFHQI